MNKLITLPAVLMLLTVFFATDVFAQRGRGRGQRGNQQNGDVRSGSQQAGQGIRRGQNARRGIGKNQQTAAGALTGVEREGLISMREEEKLARDVYLAMQEKWGARVFSNISRAETQHMTAMANLLSQYRIPDPVTDNTPGKFTAVRFQELYKTLVETGSNSLNDALKVGLKIEEMDIADLRVAIQGTNNREIKRVFENLERGSRNHLRAFARQLKAAGGTYVATNLNQSDFDQIASSEQERGGGGGQGRAGGRGNGRGKGKGRGSNNRR